MAVIAGNFGSVAFGSFDGDDVAIPTGKLHAWTLTQEQTLRDIGKFKVKHAIFVPDQSTWTVEIRGLLDDVATKPGFLNYVTATITLLQNSGEAARSWSGSMWIEELTFTVDAADVNRFEAKMTGDGVLTLGAWT